MSRVLLILAVAAVAYAMLKSRRAALSRQHATAPADQVRVAEDMVRCAQCGVHLPKSESVSVHGQYYCCEAHGRAHRQPPDHDAG